MPHVWSQLNFLAISIHLSQDTFLESRWVLIPWFLHLSNQSLEKINCMLENLHHQSIFFFFMSFGQSIAKCPGRIVHFLIEDIWRAKCPGMSVNFPSRTFGDRNVLWGIFIKANVLDEDILWSKCPSSFTVKFSQTLFSPWCDDGWWMIWWQWHANHFILIMPSSPDSPDFYMPCPNQLMVDGLKLVGVNQKQWREKEARIQEFNDHFGSEPKALAAMWYDLCHTNHPMSQLEEKEKTHNRFKRFMAANWWLWNYPKNATVSSHTFGCCRKLMEGKEHWYWVAKIQGMKDETIK